MARYSCAARSSGAGARTSATAGKPFGSIFAAANNDIYIVEVGVYNTTTTAFNFTIQRATAQGTAGSAVATYKWDPDTTAATATPYDLHTADATLTSGYYVCATIGAAAGAGGVWTFGNKGIRIPKTTGNGLALIVGTGTGQICDWYMVWDE
jgi:hypothetical protein